MIGTVICRNCDTAIEVSEGDVARFRTNPVFGCSVCQQDLTQRVAEMLGRSPVVLGTVQERSQPPRLSDNEEFTVPDDEEAFDGLPMGESFDDAALRLKAVRTPQATPVMDDPIPEDPSMLALRIAGQAQEQAQALAAKALAKAVSRRELDDDASTGVMQIGAAGSPSTEVGVVPEEPENETTARRTENAEGSVAEPTLPSDGGDEDDGDTRATSAPEKPTPFAAPASSPYDERSVDITRTPEISVPALGASGVLPIAPANEATPSVSRGNPVLVEEEPQREVTAKRSAPPAPPPRIMRTTVPRTGTGPAGIGVLGIRVVANRAVVRPAYNGKSISVPAPNAETQVTAVEVDRGSVDRPSASSRAVSAAAAAVSSPAPSYTPPVPFSSPRAGTARRTGGGGASMWALVGGGTVVLLIAGVFLKRYLDPPGQPVQTPYLEATPVAVESEIPTATPADTRAIAAATMSAAASTPTARVIPTAEQTPVLAPSTPVFPRATPTSTPTSIRTATSAPTAIAALATPRPTATPGGKSQVATLIEQARLKASTGKHDEAMRDLYTAGFIDPSHMEEIWDAAWAVGDRNGSRDTKLSIAKAYLLKFPNGKSANVMKTYLELAAEKVP